MARDQHHRQLGVGARFLEKSHAIHLRQAECRSPPRPRKSRPSRARYLVRWGAFSGNAFELQGLLATQGHVGIVFDDPAP